MGIMYCSGYVLDIVNGQPLDDCVIHLLNSDGEALKSFETNSEKRIKLNTIRAGVTAVKIERANYESRIFQVNSCFSIDARMYLAPCGPIAYTSSLQYVVGSELFLYVRSAETWRYELFRNGEERTRVIQSAWFSPIEQELPIAECVSTGLQWREPVRVPLPSSASSGLYSLTVSNKAGKSFTLPVILTVNHQHKDLSNSITVLANTNTWLAYNDWGGRSRYRNYFKYPLSGGVVGKSTTRMQHLIWPIRRKCKKAVVVFKRLALSFLRKKSYSNLRLISNLQVGPRWYCQPLSPKRPFKNSGLEAENPYEPYLDHLAAHEWRFLAWCEREGVNYNLITDQCLEDAGCNINCGKALVLIGHAEYWTSAMFTHLEDIVRNRKISLIDLSGNTAYHEVKFRDDGAMIAQRGNFEETSKTVLPLLKNYTDLSVRGFAPYKALDPGHWVFKSTGIDGDDSGQFGSASLIDTRLSLSDHTDYNHHHPGNVKQLLDQSGASGWEVDKVQSISGECTIVARGENLGGGADMFVRDLEGTSIHFSVGSIAFIGSLLVDTVSSKVLKNVFLRIGVLS